MRPSGFCQYSKGLLTVIEDDNEVVPDHEWHNRQRCGRGVAFEPVHADGKEEELSVSSTQEAKT